MEAEVLLKITILLAFMVLFGVLIDYCLYMYKVFESEQKLHDMKNQRIREILSETVPVFFIMSGGGVVRWLQR